MTLAHGGNLTEACARWGHALADWLDLSTGIAPWAYPVPAVPSEAWHRLPGDDADLLAAACAAYGAPRLLAVPGSVAAIRALPLLQRRWRQQARVIVAPLSFNEHAAAWSAAGHSVRSVAWAAFDAAVDEADVAIVCQPNNPTTHDAEPAQLLRWRERLAARGGWLVVDEAFRDSTPGRSVIGATGEPGLIVLRSLGKFYGLAGARLGFLAARPMLLAQMGDLLGPWAVSGPAQWAGTAALRDGPWQQAQAQRLRETSQRLADLCAALGWPVQRCDHFVWSEAPPANGATLQHLHDTLAQHAIWTRVFEGPVESALAHPMSQPPIGSVRIGLPGDEAAWQRLEAALRAALR